jgi:hypothetical protein
MAGSDDERETARAAILQRRSRLIAYAVAMGACAPACDGGVCLSMAVPGPGGDGGSEVAGSSGCLSGAGGMYGGGAAYPCLSGSGPSGAGEGGVPGMDSGGAGGESAAGESAGGESAAGESSGGQGGVGEGGGPTLCLSVK